MKTRRDLRAKQRLICDYILREPAKLIVSAMGSGKTVSSLTAIRELLDSFTVRHVLIVAPKLVARRTWPDEIAEWAHTACLDYAVAVGEPEERAAAIDRRAEITIINFENLQWLAKHIGKASNWYWDMVVIDESSRMKAGKKRTVRSKTKNAKGEVVVRKGGNMTRFGVLTAVRRQISRIYELTGTPTPQGVHDLWGQAYLLDQGARLGQSMSDFEDRWFNKNQYTHAITEKFGAAEEITTLVADIMVTIPPDKLVDDPVIIPFWVDLPPKVMREYREFEKSCFAEAYDVEAVTSGVLANKLVQFANGSMYREDRSVAPVHDVKLEALDEIVEQSGGENILVFYGFKFDKDSIKRRYPYAVIANEDDTCVERWNRGEIKMLLAHPASLGHGTNLQHGGHIAVWFGLTWSLELYQQASARLPRPGQKKQVLIYQILARETYDQNIVAALDSKGATQDDVIATFVDRSHEH